MAVKLNKMMAAIFFLNEKSQIPIRNMLLAMRLAYI
jgi:hypothetical protein